MWICFKLPLKQPTSLPGGAADAATAKLLAKGSLNAQVVCVNAWRDLGLPAWKVQIAAND